MNGEVRTCLGENNTIVNPLEKIRIRQYHHHQKQLAKIHLAMVSDFIVIQCWKVYDLDNGGNSIDGFFTLSVISTELQQTVKYSPNQINTAI